MKIKSFNKKVWLHILLFQIEFTELKIRIN